MLCGGPVQYAKLDEVKLTRLMLNDSTGRKREIIFDLEHLDKPNQSSLALYPVANREVARMGFTT